MYLPYGASKGSSGGVVINTSGQAVAMHLLYLESHHDILSSTERVKSESAQSGFDEISMTVDLAAANSHCSTAACALIFGLL
jgi:hypothetical protein